MSSYSPRHLSQVFAHTHTIKKRASNYLKRKFETWKVLLKPQRKMVVLTIIQNPKPPKYILPLIFELDPSQQKEILKDSGYDNALMYALAHEPETLPEFERIT